MKPTIWNKQIPSLLGILLLVGGLFATSYLLNQRVFFFTRAANGTEPQFVTITNVSDTSFTVSYQTSEGTEGTLSLGADPQKAEKIVLDDRDQATGSPQKYNLHHITVKNTTPSTSYQFFIVSGKDVYGDKGKSYTVKTGPKIATNPSTQPPLTGKISNEGEVLLVITGENIAPLSTLMKADQTYFLPLNAIRTPNLEEFAQLDPQKPLTASIYGQTSQAKATFYPSASSPLPLISLGQEYDFTTLEKTLNPTPISSESASTLPLYQDITDTSTVTLTAPETTPDSQPVFSGLGVPSETVEIEIHSEEVLTSSVKVASNGTWSYRPSTPLLPGEHTITIKTKEKNGLLKTLTRSFTVYAQGSQSTEPSVKPTVTATPTLTPTFTPTPTRGVTPSPLASPTPTQALPTATPTLMATATPTLALSTPTPTLASSSSGGTLPTPTSPPPPIADTGSMSAYALLAFGIFTCMTGLLLFIRSGKGII